MISGGNVTYLGSSRYRRLIITDLSPLRIGLCRRLGIEDFIAFLLQPFFQFPAQPGLIKITASRPARRFFRWPRRGRLIGIVPYPLRALSDRHRHFRRDPDPLRRYLNHIPQPVLIDASTPLRQTDLHRFRTSPSLIYLLRQRQFHSPPVPFSLPGLCRNLCPPAAACPSGSTFSASSPAFSSTLLLFFLHRQEELCCPPSLCRFETPAASFQKCRTDRALVRRRKRLPAAVTVENNIKNPPRTAFAVRGRVFLQRYFGKPPCFYFALSAWL